MPSEVDVTLSISEAAAITFLLGKLNHFGATRIGATRIGSDNDDDWSPYEVFTGNLFNRFWEDGLKDYFRSKRLNFGWDLNTLNTPTP